ncbi:MAG: GNAT family N-acetyltransferase [Hyphomicrobiales bacterium]|nr:GNAT family N-acetyltransferase [Hyphomicrobiales bacterium]
MTASLACVETAAPATAGTVALARVETHTSVWPALRAWREIEAFSTGSAYQTRGFVLPWFEFVAPGVGASPLIVIGYDGQNRPSVLLPLSLETRGPLRMACFAGGKHSNLNLPLLRPGFAFSAADARKLLDEAARSEARPDIFVLLNQPETWAGAVNPFAALGCTPSPSAAYGATIGADAETFLKRVDSKDTRKKLRSKAAKLAALGPVVFERAADPDRTRTILSAFVAQKTLRFARKHKDPGFAGVAMRGFLDSLATGHGGGAPALDLYALSVGDRIVATYGGLPRGRCWHGLVNSFNPAPELARSSPAELLLRHVIRDLAARGIERFDLGIGESRYKSAITEDRIDLVDVVTPATRLGRIEAPYERLRLAGKRWVKRTPWALSLVEQMRSGPV